MLKGHRATPGGDAISTVAVQDCADQVRPTVRLPVVFPPLAGTPMKRALFLDDDNPTRVHQEEFDVLAALSVSHAIRDDGAACPNDSGVRA